VLVVLVIQRFGRVLVRRSVNSESQLFVAVLLALFLAALGAGLVGVEKIVGAFLAGLAVNAVLPDGRVKEQVVFIGATLFIPVFFIDLGLLLNLPVEKFDLADWIVNFSCETPRNGSMPRKPAKPSTSGRSARPTHTISDCRFARCSIIAPRNYLDVPPPWHATTFPTPPPFPPNAEVVARDPALPGVFDDPGPPASPTAGVPMPHAPLPPQGQAAVSTAFDPPRTPESPGPHTSLAAWRVLPTTACSPSPFSPLFIAQPEGGALA